jgi:hypothetical protein
MALRESRLSMVVIFGTYIKYLQPQVPGATVLYQWYTTCCMDPLGTDSCRGTVPMEAPMSNGSMHHPDPDFDFDDTRIILQGASCTIAAAVVVAATWDVDPASEHSRFGIFSAHTLRYVSRTVLMDKPIQSPIRV